MSASNARSLRPSALGRLMQHSDAVLAMAVVAVVGMMIVPLPTWLLDMLISVNIAIALVILLVSLYMHEPLNFSVFPSLLLITTLFRLGLNISATRLILLHAHAGKVIDAFGGVVVGGNYIVGVVVFLILVIIQFVVITNGAGRVAEVAARFTLDAMPGKQMSIDADLNAGLINEDEARHRRRNIEMEADFYGAMDGASKFVKGDAIAAIIIILINILGGFAIGVLQLNMPLGKALQTFTLLTVGEGLVSQIPALLISTATGIIVTRAASDSNLGRDMTRQILANPKPLVIAAGILLALGLVPGMPSASFLVIGGGLATVAYMLHRSLKVELAAGVPAQAKEPTGELESVVRLLALEPMELEVGYGLIPLVDVDQGGKLLSRIGLIRRQTALDLGIIIPTIRIRDNLQLDPTGYVVKMRGVEVAQDRVRPNRYLAMGSGIEDDLLEGIPTKEPAFGLPAAWIDPDLKERAEMLGYTVVDPASVISTHITEVIKSHASDLLGRQEVQALINNLKQDYPAVVEELMPELLSIGEIQRVLHIMLRERVSVRNLVSILEALANTARTSRDPDVLSEHARAALARSICHQYVDEGGALHAVTLVPSLTNELAAAVFTSDQGLTLGIEPALAQRLIRRIARQVEKVAMGGNQAVVLCPSRIRLPLRRLTERSLPNIPVLAYSEVSSEIQVVAEGVVDLRSDDDEV